MIEGAGGPGMRGVVVGKQESSDFRNQKGVGSAKQKLNTTDRSRPLCVGGRRLSTLLAQHPVLKLVL